MVDQFQTCRVYAEIPTIYPNNVGRSILYSACQRIQRHISRSRRWRLVESLREFDVVMSQFGHMFAPRPRVVIAEMLRVLKPGGIIAFATWPPELLIGTSFTLVSTYMPPLPEGVSPPPQWGDVGIVRERLGSAAKEVVFDRGCMLFPALSVSNYRNQLEHTAGPMLKLVESLSASDPARLAQFRREYEQLVARYFEDNVVRQDYLFTRATKV